MSTRRWWRSHSVRMRLTLWYVAAMVVTLGVYMFAVYAFVSRSVSDAVDQQLRRDFNWAAASVYVGDDGRFTVTEPVDLLLDDEVPWVQVWGADAHDLLFQNSEAGRRPLPASREMALRADGAIEAVPTPDGVLRVLSRPSYIGPRRVIIQVARSEAPIRAQLRDLGLILVLGLPVAVTVAGLGGYSLARRALAPIERMTERARSITADRLSARLPVDSPDNEMGRLATVFNETLGRLEASFEQMRRFTTDVSHELRTPLTSIRSVGEVGLRGQRDEAAYRSIIGSMLEEADRLATLVDRLLTLSRAESRQATLAHEPVDLHAVAEEVVSHLGVLAEEKRQTMAIEVETPAQAAGDRFVLRQAVINLVDNAIKFAPPRSRIRIRIAATAAEAIIEVIDEGPGISADAQARIFDRFFREDGVEAGGTGLGLSIAKGAVEANGGRLTLERTSDRGSIFRIAMPRWEELRSKAG